MDRLEVRVSITKLLLGLIIVIVPLSIIGLILTQRGDKSLDNSVGNNFKTVALLYSTEISQSMRSRIASVDALAKEPAIVSAVTGKNAGKEMLNSPASQLLRERKAIDQQFLSIVVTNQNGDVVAASQQPPKVSYAQDALWQSVYNNGQGSGKVSEILDDEFTKSYYVNVGVPVTEPTSGATVGVVSGAVNVSDVLSKFRDAQIGNGARAELVSDDGTIVSGPNADVFARARSQNFDAVHDTAGSVEGGRNGWVMSHLQSGPYIVGYAGTGLKQHFPTLGWVVLVSQDEHQAAAPIRGLEHFALWMVVLSVFMLTLFCVYYFLHRAQQLEHIEQELKAEPPRTHSATSY